VIPSFDPIPSFRPPRRRARMESYSFKLVSSREIQQPASASNVRKRTTINALSGTYRVLFWRSNVGLGPQSKTCLRSLRCSI
jgi:hypothetical protein